MSAAERTKDRSNLLQHWEGRVLGSSSATSRKALSDRPALKPDWGKPTVRNFREEDGNGSYRAILLPERKAETPKRPSLSLRLRAPYLYPDRGDSALFLGNMGSIQREIRPSIQREDQLTMETKLEQIAAGNCE